MKALNSRAWARRAVDTKPSGVHRWVVRSMLTYKATGACSSGAHSLEMKWGMARFMNSSNSGTVKAVYSSTGARPANSGGGEPAPGDKGFLMGPIF